MQRHHITHRAQRHNIQQQQQIGLGLGFKNALLFQGLIQRHQNQKRHPHRRQMAAGAGFIQTVGIHHRHRRRQGTFPHMMINDHNIQPQIPRIAQRIMGHNAAIHRYNQFDPHGL